MKKKGPDPEINKLPNFLRDDKLVSPRLVFKLAVTQFNVLRARN
jgi:hypothetical protein